MIVDTFVRIADRVEMNPVVCGRWFGGERAGMGDVGSIVSRIVYRVQEGVVIGREGGMR
jgi:hypothetical protein